MTHKQNNKERVSRAKDIVLDTLTTLLFVVAVIFFFWPIDLCFIKMSFWPIVLWCIPVCGAVAIGFISEYRDDYNLFT